MMNVVNVKKEYLCTGDIKEILKSLIDNDNANNIMSIEINKINFIYNNTEDRYKAKIVYKW